MTDDRAPIDYELVDRTRALRHRCEDLIDQLPSWWPCTILALAFATWGACMGEVEAALLARDPLRERRARRRLRNHLLFAFFVVFLAIFVAVNAVLSIFWVR